MNAALASGRLSFQISPIIFTGGIAELFPGGMLPIITITESIGFINGLLSGSDIDLDSFFANFYPQGGSLSTTDYGRYPFANQQVAANAAIAQPLRVSVTMTCPAQNGRGGFGSKLAVMTALQAAVSAHILKGGMFTVATPSFLYENCLLLDLRETWSGNRSQPQASYQWDFEQPLLTEQQAALAFNSMMSKINNAVPSTGALSGIGMTIGSPLSLASSVVSPAAQNLAGTSIAAAMPPLPSGGFV